MKYSPSFSITAIVPVALRFHSFVAHEEKFPSASVNKTTFSSKPSNFKNTLPTLPVLATFHSLCILEVYIQVSNSQV